MIYSTARQIARPAAIILAACALVACAGTAAPRSPPTKQENRAANVRALHRGEKLFAVSCSGCHGAGARGSGPVAPLIGAPVPDLTLIAARRGGTFPVDEIYRIIDGQADLTAHGPRHMPVWGYEFFSDDPDDETAHRVATEKIESLVGFLGSIQSGR